MKCLKVTPTRLMIAAVIAIAAVMVIGDEVAGSPDDQQGQILTGLELRMQKRISVDFRSTPIDDVIRIMAEQADVDIVKSPKVVGDVTTTLTDVPLSEALQSILAAHGYGYVTSHSIIRIAPVAELTERAEMLTNRIYTITYADVTEVEKALKKFISKRGSISSNPGTGNLIVTDTESKIKAIDLFIEEIDRVTPQILVEARIYDITCTDKLDFGVEWHVGRNTGYGADGISDGGTNPTNRTDPFMSSTFAGSVGTTAAVDGLLRFGWLNSGLDIDVMLKAQKQVINATLLANPRVLVLDNEVAMIEIIREIPYQELQESSAGGSIGTTNFREVGVKLQVTPHVTRDEMVRLHVYPEFSVAGDNVDVALAGSQVLTQPQVDRRTINSILLLKNGQTMVLGGLRKKEVSTQVNKIPLLGDIPLVGEVFKSKGESTVLSELVVFVTPHIVERLGMSEDEEDAYEHTNFERPCPANPEAECKNCLEDWSK